ncbi:MAG TPA: hypothetical protein PKK00_04990 [Bacteroidales bacterium]|nr:hypothetical protein [Bacteroidales bacterium]HPS16715.1 hypothetical protein [Bacteroidales bacterium]
MSCCGKKLKELYNISETKNSKNIEHAVYYQYTGNSSVVYKGAITGIEYRFAKHGSIVGIDFRDIAQIAEIPTINKL